jgi:hypothetical protein
MANKNEYVEIFELAPDNPFITNKKVLTVLFARAAEQLECLSSDLFWVIDHAGFKTLKVRYENIGSAHVVKCKRPRQFGALSKREINERLTLLEGFFWGLTYPLELE